jgi:hypothetical protein
MGAIHFSIDPELVHALRRSLLLQVFVETGTFQGNTTAFVAGGFRDVYTVEQSPPIFARTAERLKAYPNVTAILNNAPEALRLWRPMLERESVAYWLDAHWCGGETSEAAGECPLLEELAAIGTLNATSVILIDDARYFIAPPPRPHKASHWPDLETTLKHLHALCPGTHRSWVINDVIIFAPISAAADVIAYGQDHGVDLAKIFGSRPRA